MGLYSWLCVRRLFALNPTWDVRAYNDSEIESYLRESLPLFDEAAYADVRERHIVEKTDLWRLVVLYKEGGDGGSMQSCRNARQLVCAASSFPRRWGLGE